ncbi:MAG: bifunctional serine/threonine-protein kinase/formylglycine-generating enzyme family protein [Planctomycetota bacterium]|nr:bifunctional serine/threonine-protein kinase/formylglycine-generating enzyme family protein [Planctomycetota bacterium]MDA1252730.1 bifunctional serine/threonine-protein kinase/formylglycine-generating enzyme family protein [Planctomycetota bacterium]
MNEQELFLSALEIEDAEARLTHVQAACADDLELLKRVESLLASHEAQSQFLQKPIVEQMVGELVSEPDATLLFQNGSTQDDEFETANFNQGEDEAMTQHLDDLSDEIPLGYLEPSSRDDSLGRLGHYEILEVVGRGAFGTVLRAFDEKLHRIVAIKVLAPEMAATSPARKRFLREARSSAAVRHENVVSIYAVEDEPIPYLVMEYIPGQTLQQRLNGTGPLDLEEVLRLGKQIADGLAAAHAQGLIHRDIKPGNILLDTSVDNHVKITDFGLARAADDASMTQSGMIAGTPLYMAPEQAQGQKLDQRADLFSFGSVLYQMLSGRPPFRAPNTVAVLKRVVDDAPRPIQEIIPEVPDWICELIGHLHAKNPDERYISAKQVSDVLAQCLVDVQEGRRPQVPAPDNAETVLRPALTRQPWDEKRTSKKLLPRIAAVVALLFVSLGLTEATSVTNLSSTVIRMLYGSGTLVIEIDDPSATVAINGEQVTIRGAGVDELTLSPGKYRVEAVKDGQTVRQELVSITRNGRSVVRLTLEASAPPIVATDSEKPLGPAPPPLAKAPFSEEEAKQHQKVWADYLGVPIEKEISLGQDKNGKDLTLTMVLIPPGEFMIGEIDTEQKKWLAEAKAEHPNAKEDAFIAINMEDQRFVRITKPFWLSKLEFKTGQFRRFVESTDYTTDAETSGKGAFRPAAGKGFERLPELNWDNWGKFSFDPGPVVNVSWNDAAKCCEWLSSQHPDMAFSLPTEAQWEFACRAGTKNSLYDCESAEQLRQYAQFGDEVRFIQRGGQLRPNAFGLYDMLGNVTEWCSNWAVRYDEESQPVDDPAGPAAPGKYAWRAIRGGSFMHNIWQVRSSKRDFYAPDNCFFDRGFRVAAAISDDANRSQQAAKATGPTTVADTESFQWPVDASPPAIAPFDAAKAREHQEDWAKHLGVPVEYENSIGMKFRLIPPGEFLMGSTPEEIEAASPVPGKRDEWSEFVASEGPQHRVILTRPLYLGTTEVTQEQYQQIIGDNPSLFSSEGKGKESEAVENLETRNFPVEQVSWYDAVAFCTKLSQREQLAAFDHQRGLNVKPMEATGYRLPTEAEWEFACRAGTGTQITGDKKSKALLETCWFAANSDGRTHAVGELQANPLGLLDMQGNVWEWVQDSWDSSFYGSFSDQPAIDPCRPIQSESLQVIRGGYWRDRPTFCRPSCRYANTPDHRYGIGFRVALSVDAVKQKTSVEPAAP